MGKINILTDDICNRIAAGEVIDRPYSVVKELVENSIDAGATEIEIYIERGGKELIRVIDNGCGIEKDDMKAAFYRHATSKITCMEDIDHIHTLGFRGEALSTISCIAQVELISAVEGEPANKVFCDGEFIGKVQPAVGPKGTQITVTNIFFNTPVRYRYMRTDKKEEGDITNFVIRFILGNPKISFKYYIDGKLSLQSYGGGVEEAIAQVYGAKYLPDCFKLNVVRNGLHLYGFIGNQNFFKPNKTYQSLFLNGRYIINPVIASAISNAYAPYAMKRRYPFYVLFMEVPEDIVDVNVHPSKADVRFVDNALIYGTVYKVISSVLDGTAKAADFVVDSSVVPEIKSTYEENRPNSVYAQQEEPVQQGDDKDFSDVEGIEKYTKAKQPEKKNDEFAYLEDYEEPVSSEKDKELTLETMPIDFDNTELKKNRYLNFGSGSRDFEFLEHRAEIDAKLKEEQQRIAYNTFKYRGSLFDTYILYELRDEVFIIDQHAAHERLLYDGLIKKYESREIAKQVMIIPFIIDVTPEEKEFIENNIQTIWRLGFSVEPFSKTSYRVYEVPADLPNLNAKEFFDDLLSNVGELKKITLADVMKDKLAQAACKHAVKGGDTLTENEVKKLFEMLNGNLGLKCPHGRPICTKLTKTELEKMFKRKL